MYKAIILAAGQGTRLRPLTNYVPKGLIKFRNKSLLDRQIDILREGGIREIFIIGGYKFNLLKDLQCKLIVNEDFDKTNMVRSLFKAKKLFNDKSDLIISYADILYELSVLEKLKEKNGDIVISSDKEWENLWSRRMKNYLDDVESFKTSSDGFIKEIGKKTNTTEDIEAQYIGLIKIPKGKQKEIYEIYKDSFLSSNYNNLDITTFIASLIKLDFKITPSYINNGWLEFDTLRDWKKYNYLQDKNKLLNLYKIEEYNIIDKILSDINKRIYSLENKYENDFSIIEFIKNVNNNPYEFKQDLIIQSMQIARKIEISDYLFRHYKKNNLEKTNKSKKLSFELIILLLTAFLKIFYITNNITYLNTILKGIDKHINYKRTNKNLKTLKEIIHNELINYYE